MILIFCIIVEPGVPYNVSIAAVNRAGSGEVTASIHFTRELGTLYENTDIRSYWDYVFFIVPSIAPKNVTTIRTKDSPTVMVASWIPLSYSEARGFISHYTVTYSLLQDSGRKRQALVTMNQTVAGMDAYTASIEDLDASTDYNVWVSATNGAGTSQLSQVEIVFAPGGI